MTNTQTLAIRDAMRRQLPVSTPDGTGVPTSIYGSDTGTRVIVRLTTAYGRTVKMSYSIQELTA
jgi:hypothetical protein